MSTQAPAETEVVSGQVVGVITKPGDKWQIEVSTGGQYTRRLWTKDAGLVNQMNLAVGQSFDFICGVSHWTGNQGPVRSLWVNSVAMFGSTPVAPTQQVPGTGAVQPIATPVNTQGQPLPSLPQVQQQIASGQWPQGLPSLAPMEKEERIMREHAMGVVALMLPHMPPAERNALGMINVAEGLIRYYREGPPPTNGQQPATHESVHAGNEPVQEQIPTPHPDDDIPF